MNLIVALLEHLMLLPKIAINKFINKNQNILIAFRCIVLLTINNTRIYIYYFNEVKMTIFQKYVYHFLMFSFVK